MQSPAVMAAARCDRAMQLALRLASLQMFDRSLAMLGNHPQIMMFILREGGGLILYELLSQSRPTGAGRILDVFDPAVIARHYGVSVVHVRNLVRDAAAVGLITVEEANARASRLVLPGHFVDLCDRWFAAAMALFHECCEMAWADLAKAG